MQNYENEMKFRKLFIISYFNTYTMRVALKLENKQQFLQISIFYQSYYGIIN